MDAREGQEAVEELGKKGYAAANEHLEEAKDTFETFSANARKSAEATWEKTIDLVQENPVSAVGIALLVGAGIGALLTAWSSD